MNKTDVMSWIYFSHPKKADIVNILIIIAIWTVMVIVVNPLGNFPLNDDWVYGSIRSHWVYERPREPELGTARFDHRPRVSIPQDRFFHRGLS